MPLCTYQTEPQTGETRVDNRFIREYLFDAPEDAVKVYLYGLMQCQTGRGAEDWEGFSRGLNLDPARVRAAFSHWQKMGLCDVREDGIRYLIVKKRERAAESAYPLGEFNREIAALFAPRELSPSDYRRIYDWMDVFGIAQNAVPLLIQYGRTRMKEADTRSVSAQLNYIDKIARSWAEDGVLSVLKAEGWIKKQELASMGIHQVMRALGMHRNPTQAEWDLFSSWVEMGFTAGAMTAAAERLVGSYTPSFKRLGDVLGEFYERDLIEEGDIRRFNRGRAAAQTGAGAMMAALGVENPTPTAGQRSAYEGFLQDGYPKEMVLYAAEVSRAEGRSTTLGVKAVLERLRKKGAHDLASAKEIQKEYEGHRNLAMRLLSQMGAERRPNPGEIEQVAAQLEYGMSEEALLYGAEQSIGAKYPWRLYSKMVSGWMEQGIKTADEARAAQKAREDQAKSGTENRRNSASDYEQRTYESGELDELFIQR